MQSQRHTIPRTGNAESEIQVKLNSWSVAVWAIVMVVTALIAAVKTRVADDIYTSAVVVNHAENLPQHHCLKILLLTRIEVIAVLVAESHRASVAIV